MAVTKISRALVGADGRSRGLSDACHPINNIDVLLPWNVADVLDSPKKIAA